MRNAIIAIGAIAVLGMPALTMAAPIDRTTVVAQAERTYPPHHRKRVVIVRPRQPGPSHSFEHSDSGGRSGGGTTGSGDRTGGGAGGGSHDTGGGGAGGGSHDR